MVTLCWPHAHTLRLPPPYAQARHVAHLKRNHHPQDSLLLLFCVLARPREMEIHLDCVSLCSYSKESLDSLLLRRIAPSLVVANQVQIFFAVWRSGRDDGS
jgi:hypothetical protein